MRIEEAFQSRDQSKDSATLVYFVFECATEQEAKNGVLGTAPGLYDGLYYQDFHYEIINETTHKVEVQYGLFSSEKQSTWRYSTNGGTTRVKQSLQTIGNYAAGDQTPPNYHGAIGVTKDSIEGVDIVTPNCSYSESHYKSFGLFTAAYANTLALMTGTVNNAPFRAWAAGEVLFVGGTIQSATRDGVTVDYEFILSPNATNIVIGDITVPSKYGWDYLWFTYYTGLDENTGCLIEIPRSAHVDRVYKFVDFGALLI